jgi:AMIN domain-containing protein
MSQVRQIQVQTEENHTRVLVEVEDKVECRGARIANPDRIYFDLRKTKLSPSLAGRILEVQSGGLLKAVRAAQNQVDVVRVVLEVNQAKDYSVAWLPDPYRLVVNVYGSPLGASATLPTSAPTPTPNPRPTPSAAASAPSPPLAKSALGPKWAEPRLGCRGQQCDSADWISVALGLQGHGAGDGSTGGVPGQSPLFYGRE